jgi:hypothetical protein
LGERVNGFSLCFVTVQLCTPDVPVGKPEDGARRLQASTREASSLAACSDRVCELRAVERTCRESKVHRCRRRRQAPLDFEAEGDDAEDALG